MEAITLTKDQLNDIVIEATTKAVIHLKELLEPKEDGLQVTKFYRVKDVAKFLDCSVSTVLRAYTNDPKCLLKRNKRKMYSGQSIKAEYERINGK